MLKIENTEVIDWEYVIRGMRNSKNSWEKTDSYPAVDCGKCGKIEREGIYKKEDRDYTGFECFEVDPNDLNTAHVTKEIGDMAWYLAVSTNAIGYVSPLCQIYQCTLIAEKVHQMGMFGDERNESVHT